MMQADVAEKADADVSVLDEDIGYVEATLSRLDGLRGLMIKRDAVGLEPLLSKIAEEAEAPAAKCATRQQLTRDLAGALGAKAERVTLAELQSRLPEAWGTALVERRTRLRSLAADLKREYSLTSTLLSDCARFNRLLMRAYFGAKGQSGVTYNPNGATRQHANRRLMSLQF
jgi:hypothetical protein